MKQKFFDDLFSEGKPVWLKIGGAALFTPVFVVLASLRAMRRSGDGLHAGELALVVAGSIAVGALLGGALAAKDVVARRMAAGQHVPWPLKLLLGSGALSLLVWFVLAITVTVAVTMLALA
ncbi:MAG: hypothetical protein AAF790_04600 [Planctomycetota bacterium]